MSTSRLACTDLSAGYNGAPVIEKIDLRVAPGECVAIIGRNGVGKTTTARVLAGSLKLLAGSIAYEGQEISTWPPDVRARAGITFASDDRPVFRQLTVEENLRLAARSASREGSCWPEWVPPLLKERFNQRVGKLSGGEQQILAIACALATAPRVLIIDEFTEGLAVSAVTMVEQWLLERTTTGLSTILIDQRIDLVLSLATRCYVLDLVDGRGTVVLASTTDLLAANGDTLRKHLAI